MCMPLPVVTTSNNESQCESKKRFKKNEGRHEFELWTLDSRWRLTKNGAFAFHVRKRHAQISASQQSHTDEIDFAGWIHFESCCLSSSSLPVPNDADSFEICELNRSHAFTMQKMERNDLRKADVEEVSKANCPTMLSACVLCAMRSNWVTISVRRRTH